MSVMAIFRQQSRTSTVTFPQIAQARPSLYAVRVSGRSMKDLHTVLRQKEQDVERVRREIQALLTAIPLLADDQSASDDLMHILRLASAGTEPSSNGMADLETYYPFVRHLRASERR